MQKIIGLIIFSCVIWAFTTQNHLKSQDVVLLRVESGGSIHFPINSMQKYREGMALENWTRLAVFFSDTDTDIEWELQVRAMSNVIIGDFDFDLPLDYLQVVVANFTGVGNIELIELSDDFQSLINGATQGDFSQNKIHITYRLGNDAEKQLKGNPFGYYYVDLEFCLRKNGDVDKCQKTID